MTRTPAQAAGGKPARKTPSRPAKQADAAVPVVAIGTSAGGLEALKELLPLLPAGRGFCYLIAQHLSPKHGSMLPDLLRPTTRMPVSDVRAGQRVEPDGILIVPPNHDVVYEDGRLSLRTPQATVGPKPSVDRLFHSLAAGLGERAVGIILTGTGSDGADGMRAIKAAGGICIAQDPASARYDGMPTAALRSGSVDVSGTLAEIGEVLDSLTLEDGSLALQQQAVISDDATTRIAAIVKQQTSFPLASYKQSTVKRRIARRMGLLRIKDLAKYLELLEAQRPECLQLGRDVLISVTSFMRDTENFDALRIQLASEIEGRGPQDVYRVWVSGCATGEEAYSVAMILAELLRERAAGCEFLIFASDLDTEAVNFARAGVYSEGAVARLPKELVDRYFDRQGSNLLVKKFLRHRMVFAVQNLLEDPPFSRVDLVTCRNLLIYLERPAQMRCFASFHYALNPRGLMFLGKAESVEHQRDLFEPVNARARLYRSKAQPGDAKLPMLRELRPLRDRTRAEATRHDPKRSVASAAEDVLRAVYVQPSLVVDDHDKVLQLIGELAPFVGLPRNPADFRAFDVIHSVLRPEARALLQRARRTRETVTGRAQTVRIRDQSLGVRLVVRPCPVGDSILWLVSFESVTQGAARPAVDEAISAQDSLVMRELERELASTREQLQSMVEEVETSNEELQAHGEELASANEELQSTNEELQTTNEELQSTNEELLTLNDEVRTRSTELELLSTLLSSIKDSLDFPIIALDDRLHLLDFNAAAQNLLAKQALLTDASLSSLEWNLELLKHTDAIREVIRTSQRVEIGMHSQAGRDYRVRVSPYRLLKGGIAGAVLSFIDETEDRAMHRAVAEREALYRVSFTGNQLGMAVIDASGRVREHNPAFDALADAPRPDGIDSLRNLVANADWPKVEAILARMLERADDFVTFDFRTEATPDRQRVLEMSAATIAVDGRPDSIVAQFRDVTFERQHSGRLESDVSRLKLLSRISVDVRRQSGTRQFIDDSLAMVAAACPEWRVSFAVVDGDALVTRVSHAPEPLADTTGLRLALDAAPGSREQLSAGETMVIANLRQVPRHGWADVLARTGVRSRVDVPLVPFEKLYGVISLERADAGDWPEDAMVTLRAVADLIAVGLRDVETLSLRDRLAAQLALEKERAEVTLRSISDAVITTDAAGCITYLNPAAVRLLDTKDRDVAGTPVVDLMALVSSDSGEPVEHPVTRALADGSVIEDQGYTTAVQLADGRRVVINSSSAPLVGPSGKLYGAVMVLRDVSGQRQLSQELNFRASHDPLTGLTNRDEFQRRLRYMLDEAKRTRDAHAILYIDLDGFKIVNDTSGHTAGDELLKLVALRLRGRLRSTDTISRLGGDEFAAIIGNCDMAGARLMADSMLMALREIRFRWQERTYQVGASIGVVPLTADSGSAQVLMSTADAACYLAKEGGRDRSYVLLPEDEQFASRRSELDLVARIKQALEEGLFTLHVENVINLNGAGEVMYRELLVRMQQADGTLLQPAAFLPTAARFGLMPLIDRWVIERTLKFLLARPAEDKVVTAVNLSAEVLADDRFGAWLQKKLEEYAIDPRRLCFEISEAVAVSQLSRVAPLLTHLADRGCRLALDDFGAGSTSLAHLKALPLAYVKIDGAYTRHLLSDRINRTLVESVNRIIHELGLTSIAEYVDSLELAEALREIGVDYGQGHALSKPLSLDAL